MPSILHIMLAGLLAYAGPLLAALIAGAGALSCRGKGRREMLPAVGSLAMLAGLALLLPWGLRAAVVPRAGPELLLVPAAAATLLMVVTGWLRGRWQRWAPIAVAVFAAWWLASSPGGRIEFWRVWILTGLLAWLLAKVVRGEAFRGLSAALGLAAGLALLGVGSSWDGAALVVAAAWAGLLLAGSAATVPAGLTAALIAGADLGAGRLLRGGLNGADFACLAVCAAPLLARGIAPRMQRLGGVGPVLAAVMAAGVVAAAAWLAHRATRT